ncbi:MAG: FHA domain-containing protein [Gemmataceae bacterium]|nr:FHA domain-containing protein [Gemmataceae bacterium]
MPSKHDEPLSPNKAALVLLYGNAERKYRLLDRDVLVIGRASGADWRLEAPDVSNLHCIITRGPHGYHLRDCASRAGTRVNGHAVQEVILRDEDVLQVGPFSFRVQLPANVVAPARPAQESKQDPKQPPTKVDERAPDVGRQLSALRARVAEHDQRVRQLEHAERELHRDRGLLNQEAADLEARIQKAEEQLARRKAEVEAELTRRQQEFEQRLSEKASQSGEQNGDLEARRKELDTLAARLDERQRRQKEQEQALAAARARLESETQKIGEELAQRQAEAEAEIASRRDEVEAELARRQAALEAELTRRQQPVEQRHGEPAGQAVEPHGSLDIRRKQLDALAARLEERQRRLEEQEREVAGARAQLAREAEQLNHERQERLKMREDRAREQAEANDQLARRAEAVAKAEAGLREQRAALLRMMGELKHMQEAFREQDGSALTVLQQENESLRRALAERDKALLTREEGQTDRARLAVERAQALAERDQALAERDQILQEALALQQQAQQPPPLGEDQNQAEELASLQSTVELLRGLIGEKDALIEELQNQPPRVVTEGDLAALEKELNQFRRQLESDRQKLTREIESVRTRNEELDEATRELELEMSRERADLARERQRLERLREEVRAEVEKGQREGGVRDRLAPVQKLRDEINERRQGPTTPSPAANGARSLPGR